MHEIRAALRGVAVVLMGKNTMVRRALRGFIAENPEYERLLPHVKGNVGFVRGSIAVDTGRLHKWLTDDRSSPTVT